MKQIRKNIKLEFHQWRRDNSFCTATSIGNKPRFPWKPVTISWIPRNFILIPVRANSLRRAARGRRGLPLRLSPRLLQPAACQPELERFHKRCRRWGTGFTRCFAVSVNLMRLLWWRSEIRIKGGDNEENVVGLRVVSSRLFFFSLR